MKKIILLLVAAIAVISCKNESPIDYAVISGKITNKNVGELTINSRDESVKETVKVLEDGSFIDTLRVKEGIYILGYGKNLLELFIEEGVNIKIDFDANDFKTSLNIYGEGSKICNYLRAKRQKSDELKGKGMTAYELEESDYKSLFGEIKTVVTDMLNATEGISEKFKIREKRAINYAYLEKLNIYERYHAHFAEKPEFKISEGFLNELEDLAYDNEEDFLYSVEYKNLVTSHYTKQASELAKNESIKDDLAYLNTVSAITNETIKNGLLFYHARYSIIYTEDLENYYKTYMSRSTNEENNKIITESYNELKSVAKGQPSPKFVGYENYLGGTTSLEELKGKYVYVDVWATWCGPCKREIPSLKEVEKKYHGKNIEFVSISVDKAKDHDKWKKMIEEKELKGIQLLADKDWNSDFVKGYLIKGIPRFILIDPQGNIVSSNAPRPSEDKLIDLFNELNI